MTSCHSLVRYLLVFSFSFVLSLASHTLKGSPCSPPPGYLPITCRTLRLVSTASEPLPPDEYGVNACEVTRTYEVQVYNYQYKQQCGWTYNKHYRYYYWNCRLECVPGSSCSDQTRLDERTQHECCEGFVPRPAQHYNQYNPFYLYYIPQDTQPDGCPLARANTLLECLEIHGLTRFIELIKQSNLEHLLNNSDSRVTVFAPLAEALEGIGPLDDQEAIRFVQSHIVDQEIPETKLYHTRQLDTLSDVTLYVTLVEHYFYRPLLWSQPSKGYNPYTYNNYHLNQNNYILLSTDRFISGAKITEPDACVIRDGHLHLIDAAVPITNQSLIDIISSNTDLSVFNMALDTLNLKSFLEVSDSPHTIFAPSNTAFEDFPMELIDCLSRFDREPLNDLILFHISKNINYLSSLSQQMWIYTRLLVHMQISLDDNGNVLLGREKVPIFIPNIPASDGVIHIIDDLIFPKEFDYGDCEPFVGSGMELEN